MHCNVGFAILVKVGPIRDCFDGGTQAVSMVGTPVSLMPRSKASRRSVSSTAAADHMRGAQSHELSARIWKLQRRPDLGLRRTTQNGGNDNREGADTKEHEGFTGTFLGSTKLRLNGLRQR